MAFTSKIRMFHYFIKPLTLGVFFGLYHGIVFIPLACYYFGPSSVADMVRRSQKGLTNDGGDIGGGALDAELEMDERKEANIGGGEAATAAAGNETADEEDTNFSCLSVKITPDSTVNEGGRGPGDCGLQ